MTANGIEKKDVRDRGSREERAAQHRLCVNGVLIVQEQILIGGQIIRKFVQHILQKRFDMSGW